MFLWVAALLVVVDVGRTMKP